jgi:hypothetical protein
MLNDAVGVPIAIALGVALLAWFVGGNELMRRRARRLAIWSKRALDPLGGQQSVRWLTQQAFRLELERLPPRTHIRSASLTGLVEAWDVPFVWLWNRLHGRRDMILVQLQLATQPAWGLELYRPGTLLAGDARDFARQEHWAEQPLDEFVVASAGEPANQLASRLLNVLEAERRRLVRLALRRQGTHLTIALNIPDPQQLEPGDLSRLLERLIRALAQ